MDPTSTHDHKNPTTSPSGIKPVPEDEFLAYSTYLSREQILQRRSYHLKQLAKCYRGQYWGLMEELKVKHREYVWKLGRNPFVEEQIEEDKDNVKDEQVQDVIDDGTAETGNENGRSKSLICSFDGCNQKAMILTTFCRYHILSDPKQQLYKPCEHVIKSANLGSLLCGKPALRSMVPSLCAGHFHIAQEHVIRAFRKAGLDITSTDKIAPKLHVVVAEYVRQIQEKRRKRKRVEVEN